MKWEYLDVIITAGPEKNFRGGLNAMGEKGWELVRPEVVLLESGERALFCIFKRPVPTVEKGEIIAIPSLRL